MMTVDREKMEGLFWLAEKMHRGGAFKEDVKNPEAAFTILLAGAELGFAPTVAARLIGLVKGKISLSADATIGLVKSSPACKLFRLVESTPDQATYVTHREGDPEPTLLTWTIAQATKAGLTTNGTWKSHPAAMLRARCGAALARAVYPDVVAGIYDPDEAEEIRRDDHPPADYARPQLNAPDPLARFRERVAGAATPTELVALVLSLSADRRAAAWPVAEARAKELGAPDLVDRVAKAEALTREPQAWSLASDVLAEIAAAKSDEDLTAILRTRGPAVAKLPTGVANALSSVVTHRRKALAPPTSLAAAFEAEMRAARDFPTLDAVTQRAVDAAKAGKLTTAEAAQLSDLYTDLSAALERPEAA